MSQRDYIHELPRKLSVIAEALHEIGELDGSSRASLARHCGLNIKTLNSACAASRMKKEMQGAIAAASGFEVTSRSWIDTNIPGNKRHLSELQGTRKDTCDHFKRHLYSELGLAGQARVGVLSETPKSKNADFASVSLTDYGQTASLDTEVHCHLEMSVSCGYLTDGLSFGFRRMRVRFGVLDQLRGKIAGLLESDDKSLNQKVTVCRRGTSSEPYWEITSLEPVLHGEFRTDEAPLAAVEILNAPVSVKVELSAHLFDGSLVTSTGAPLPTTNKARVIERLASMSIADEPSVDDRVQFSAQRAQITFV